jgi:hypothetical protein
MKVSNEPASSSHDAGDMVGIEVPAEAGAAGGGP